MTEKLEQIKRSQQGDKVALDNLVLDNLGLVHAVVKRFCRKEQDKEDLFQVGVIGLMKAIERFDEAYQVQFSTYAVPLISGEIRRYLRDDGMVKVARSIKENSYRIGKAKEELFQEKGREISVGEIAEFLEMPLEDVILALEANAEVESIYRPVYTGGEEEIFLIDQLKDNNNQEEQLFQKMILEEGLELLDEKEQRLIRLRYFENMTQSQIADQLGMTQVQVSRMEKKLLQRMNRQLSGHTIKKGGAYASG